MKRREHSDHSRVFDKPGQTQLYYSRHRKRKESLSRNIVRRLKELGFAGGKLLDAGCGYGIYSIEIAKYFPDCTVTATDLSEPMLELGRTLAAEHGVSERVQFIKDDVQQMSFTDGFFDAVISINMLHHVKRPDAMLNESVRVLKHDGILLMHDVRRNWLGYFIHPYDSGFTAPEVCNLISTTKLKNCTVNSGFLWLRIEKS